MNTTLLKKSGAAVIFMLIFNLAAFAQAPEKMSYQAVIRNANGSLAVNKTVGIRISIMRGTINELPEYIETHTPTTNANGLVSLEVGAGTVVKGNFSELNWAPSKGNSIAGPFFIKTETDPAGGTNYTISGTNELLSVPYALHAKTATTTSLGFGQFYTEASFIDNKVLAPGELIPFTNALPENFSVVNDFFYNTHLTNVGTYQVSFKVNIVGDGAVVLKLNNQILPYTRSSNTPGISQITGTVQFTAANTDIRFFSLINASADSNLILDGYDTNGNEIISTLTVTQLH